jgi:diguanylate cyclase (GGDEF)-like protein/PAS domain S-box-containing protein
MATSANAEYGERLQAALRRSSDVAIIFDPQSGEILFVSPSCEHVTGYQPEQLIGTNGWGYVHPEDRQASALAMIQTVESGSGATLNFEWRLRRADDSWHWFDVTMTDMTADPAVRGIVGNLRDVNEERRSQRLLAEREEQLRIAFEAAELATWEVDIATGETRSSPNARSVLGLEGIGDEVTIRSAVHPDDRHLFTGAPVATARAGEAFALDFRVVRPGGGTRWMHGRGRVLADDSGDPTKMIGAVMDVTAKRDAERATVESETVLRRTVEASHDAFIGADEDGNVTDWNPAAEELFGWSESEVLGRPLLELIVPHRRRSRTKTRPPRIGRLMDDLGDRLVEMTVVDRSGRRFPAELSLITVEQQDGKHLKAFVRDIASRKAMERQLTTQALTDPLTHLPNRTLLRDRLSLAVARLDRNPGMVAVMFLDLDRFKVVNDSLGHDAGDELLVEVARRIKSVVRRGDTVARFGGDEFVVVTEPIEDREVVIALAERIVAAVAAPLYVGEHEVRPSVSLGIALAEDGEAKADALMRDADLAMYHAKERGGERIEVFAPEMRSRAVARLEVEAELRRAIDREELRVHFQPVVSFSGQIVGLEALAWWQHPERGLVPPADFVPLAEETGLVIPMGAWVLRHAARAVARWRTTIAPGLRLAVNISARQLEDPGLAGTVAAILAEEGLDPPSLCLEITETALMRDAEASSRSLESLRAIGIRMAVDDFGTGYSSLFYLRRFPLQVLKLDRFVVAGLGRDPEDTAIIGSVIRLAHALGLEAVAEGVETPHQGAALAALGCDLAQGLYWAQPAPQEEIERLLAADKPLPNAVAATPDERAAC